MLFGILSIGNSATNVCCEKTQDGAWCQNSPESECDSGYRSVPSSCESTSYCKLGCCYDSQEGTCTKNTPQKVCQDNGGVWEDEALCEIPQCELGCCLIGDQAAFVTQTRCKKLSSLYGLETNYRTDISNELSCISTASSHEKGACVFEREFEKTCKMTTREECNNIEASSGEEDASNVKFHQGYLCSAEELGTNCGPTEKTTCAEGKEEVYFLDSCGNIANVYDASKINDKTYWKYIAETTNEISVCGQGKNNADSATCGNCDYYLGSTCKEYERGTDRVKPNYGDYICRDLGCEYQGESYEHGETWCADSPGAKDGLPGSRDFRMICYNGEVSAEPCADYRQEVCIESEVNGFRNSGCVVNKWEACTNINEKDACEDPDRDCKWIEGEGTQIKCFPETPVGLSFWGGDNETGDDSSQEVCDKGDYECTVKYEKGLLDSSWDCVENCHCIDDSWRKEMETKCKLLGDCGSQNNYLGYKGDNKNSWEED